MSVTLVERSHGEGSEIKADLLVLNLIIVFFLSSLRSDITVPSLENQEAPPKTRERKRKGEEKTRGKIKSAGRRNDQKRGRKNGKKRSARRRLKEKKRKKGNGKEKRKKNGSVSVNGRDKRRNSRKKRGEKKKSRKDSEKNKN